MNAVVRPAGVRDHGPMVLLESRTEPPRGRAWLVSLLMHALALTLVLLTPRTAFEPRQFTASVRSVTPLVAPPRELTQREQNRGRPAREFTLEGLLPRPPLRVPAAVPPLTRADAGRPAAVPGAQVPKPAPRQVIEAPQLESTGPLLAQAPPPGSAMTGLPAAPPPQIQSEEKPKIAFETPGRPSGTAKPGGLLPGRIMVPSDSVTEAARAAMRAGAGGTAVADIDLPGSGGFGGGLNLPGQAPRNSSSVEMLSDPQGVDFKPYLIQVLASVKRNWLAVIPESARLGRQGRVQIQFAIARNGSVPKLVIALPSGTEALDRAAVAGISASNPFPPLPSSFKGDQVRLQFTFTYNMK